jgi:hypothetical protein
LPLLSTNLLLVSLAARMDLKTDPTSLDAPDVADEKQHHMVRDEVYIDPKEEKALLRKLDRWIVPPVMLLYLFSFLDRVS